MSFREFFILLVCGVIYVFSAKGYVEVTDTQYSIDTAISLVNHGRLDIATQDGAVFQGKDGKYYSKYGIGLPLYYIPWISLSQLASRYLPVSGDVLHGFVISFANIPLTLLMLYFFIRILRGYQVPENHRLLLVTGLGLGSILWRYTCYDFSEAMQACLLVIGYFGVTENTKKSAWVCGCALSILVLVKIVYVIFVPLFVIALLCRVESIQRGFIQCLRLGVPVILAGVVLAWLNTVRFDSPVESGYGDEASMFVLSQITNTLPALIASLDKGIFIFSPVIFLGVFGWVSFFRIKAQDAFLCLGLIILNLVISSTWHSWFGGWSWGPRLLVPFLPFWLIPAAFWLKESKSNARYYMAVAIVCISIIAQIPSLLVRDQQIHHIKLVVLNEEERKATFSDYRMSWIILGHKLSQSSEIYSAKELGIDSNVKIDLSEHRTFHGFNVWTEHLARYFNKPAVRILPIFGLLLIIGVLVGTRHRFKGHICR